MLNFLGAAFSFRRRASSGSSQSNSGGIEVQVGKPPHAQTVYISQSALRSCSILAHRLTNGSAIVNADADIFEVVVEDLSRNDILDLLRPNTPAPLKKLTGGEDQMLKLAKAWHLAEMLDQQNLQNKLVDIFRFEYLELLEAGVEVHMCGDAFVYLRDEMGNHSRLEKFIVDFYAGLFRHQKELGEEQLKDLPNDAARSVRERHAYVTALGKTFDPIAANHSTFKVSGSDKTRRTGLHILPPPKLPLDENTSQPPLRRTSSCLVSRPKSMSIASRSSSFPVLPQSTQPSPLPHRRQSRTYPSLSGITSVSEAPEDAVLEILIPLLQPSISEGSLHRRPGPPSPATSSFARAPFRYYNSKDIRRQIREAIEESEDEDEEDVGESSASGLQRYRIDSHQIDANPGKKNDVTSAIS